jgi:uncharacterized protein YaaR (DUF327 family)
VYSVESVGSTAIKSAVLKHERAKLKLRRAKAQTFMDAYENYKNTTVVWQVVALDERVQELEDELVILTARRLSLTSLGVSIDSEE